jgi:hypothetical protein
MGRQVVSLAAEQRLVPGVYLVRLIHGDRRLLARTVIVR